MWVPGENLTPHKKNNFDKIFRDEEKYIIQSINKVLWDKVSTKVDWFREPICQYIIQGLFQIKKTNGYPNLVFKIALMQFDTEQGSLELGSRSQLIPSEIVKELYVHIIFQNYFDVNYSKLLKLSIILTRERLRLRILWWRLTKLF